MKINNGETCKHEQISIVEFADSQTEHDREADGTWTHNSDFADYTGMIYVNCRQCGLERYYNRLGKKFPKWLKARWNEFAAIAAAEQEDSNER